MRLRLLISALLLGCSSLTAQTATDSMLTAFTCKGTFVNWGDDMRTVKKTLRQFYPPPALNDDTSHYALVMQEYGEEEVSLVNCGFGADNGLNRVTFIYSIGLLAKKKQEVQYSRIVKSLQGKYGKLSKSTAANDKTTTGTQSVELLCDKGKVLISIYMVHDFMIVVSFEHV